MKIKTTFDNPPIPHRSFDWSAVTEDYDLGHPIGHGSTEAEAIADLQEQLGEPASQVTCMSPLTHPDESYADTESLRSPCLSCSTVAILSDSGFCCSCQQELRILKALRENHPVYVLTENLGFYKVLSIQKEPNEYLVKASELSFPLRCQLEDFHLSVPSLVTTGIARANDAILRFNHLHKQYLALT